MGGYLALRHMSTVFVHIERPTERARYAVRQVLERLLGWQVSWCHDAVALRSMSGPKLVYGAQSMDGALHVRPAGLLQATGREAMEPAMGRWQEMPVLFPVADADLPFDPFSGAFYLLTRYEELTGVPEDALGRPVASALHQARHGYIERPVVDEWALAMAAEWRKRDPQLPDPVRRYRQVVTIDLDNGFKYLGREAWRSMGSAAQDLLNGRFVEVGERLLVLAGQRPDPFDLYARLAELLPPHAERIIFFVLAGDRGPNDHAVPLTYAPYAQRVRGLRSWAEVGVHPSFESSRKEALITTERDRVSAAIGAEVRSSRQHFLRMRLPATYRALLQAGITEDHTMGLHDAPGFRAGTCTPYAWYDVEQERTTELVVHPFAVMDNTLRNKLCLTPEQAVERCATLVDRVRGVRGTFSGVWHESFLSGHGRENRGWDRVILSSIAHARP